MGVEIVNNVKYAYYAHATLGLLGYVTTPNKNQYRLWQFQCGIWSIHCRETDDRYESLDWTDVQKYLEKH